MHTLREQFLERLTRAFFMKAGSGFVLKGGGAMRALYGAQRLTQDIDLDFTNPKRTADSLHHSVRAAIDSAARGLPLSELHIKGPGKAETSPRWKVNFKDADGHPVHVEIEISRDLSRAAPGRIIQQPFVPVAVKGIPRFWVDIYDEPTLIATKLAALLGREVPRDVYDLDVLSAQPAVPDAAQIAWAIARADIPGQDPQQVLWTHLDALSYERFESELRGALSDDIAERIDEDEWTAMKLRVGQYAETLLASAETAQ